MPIQQTIDIPAHPEGEKLRLTIDVPREVPAGPVILTFTQAVAKEPLPSPSVEERIAALNHLVGIAANNPMTLEEIRDERLSRQ
ncbi:hypothetical protein AGMMS49942_12000 [Spirochaetia bacterium]|nr:hypothetical protein AGMMS49942_12000 [Spirochaetia bacterium]